MAPALVAKHVGELLSLDVSARSTNAPGEVLVRVSGLERPHGFAVRTSQGLATAKAHLELDSLAGPLLSLAGQAEDQAWEQLRQAQESLAATGIRVEFKAGLPAPSGLGLTDLSISAVSADWEENPSQASAKVSAVVISLVLLLIPWEHSIHGSDVEQAEVFAQEGGVRQGTYNRYERSRSNRAIAILAHGTRCEVCDFDFAEVYGDLGHGYVEIHHRTPVHLMEERRVVNPYTELVPLCANCHRMVHQTDPPVDTSALSDQLEKRLERSGVAANADA